MSANQMWGVAGVLMWQNSLLGLLGRDGYSPWVVLGLSVGSIIIGSLFGTIADGARKP